MSAYYFHLTEDNKKDFRPSATNRLCFSHLKNIFTTTSDKSFSIAYVTKGTEHYKFGKKTFRVDEQYFLTYGPQSAGHGVVDSKSPVNGICISVDFVTISGAFMVLSSKEDIDLDKSLCNYFGSPDFFDHVYYAEGSPLGKLLMEIASLKELNRFDPSDINEEWFLDLAGKIVLHENQNLRGLFSLSSIRTSTKKEILKRLYMGREFIDQHFCQKIDVRDIARFSMMSEFHFLRSFKEVFRISPHQYLVKKRLTAAKNKILSGHHNFSEIATEYGFADIYSFSKAFKKHFGTSPSQLLPSN